METINHPPHYNYNESGVEAIDVIEHMSFNLGNAMKYIWRAPHKGKQLEDLKKAIWYTQREIQRLEKENEVMHEETGGIENHHKDMKINIPNFTKEQIEKAKAEGSGHDRTSMGFVDTRTVADTPTGDLLFTTAQYEKMKELLFHTKVKTVEEIRQLVREAGGLMK